MQVGTRSGDAGDMNVSFRQQVLTMMNFRKGRLNCLFATSVAEEGLDIPDCNLVIRFDLYATLIQYIQSRGRARHTNSRYIHMCEDGNQEHHQIIREVRQNEGILKRFCSALPEDRLLTGNSFDMDYFLARERTHRVWKNPDTGAKLTYKMSLAVLSNFVDSLPHNQDTNSQPEYVVTVQNRQFLCEAILPESSPLRGAIGRPASTKQVAKCSAAFETCLALIEGKYLDDWLVPTFTKQLPAMRNALLAVDSKKRESYDMKTKPTVWTAGWEPKFLYMTVLALETPNASDRPCQPLALLTRAPLPQLPSFYLHFGAGRHSQVLITPIMEAWEVTPELLELVNTFTLCIFEDVFSKGYQSDPSKMPYFLVPIASCAKTNIESRTHPTDLIAWDILHSVQDHIQSGQAILGTTNHGKQNRTNFSRINTLLTRLMVLGSCGLLASLGSTSLWIRFRRILLHARELERIMTISWSIVAACGLRLDPEEHLILSSVWFRLSLSHSVEISLMILMVLKKRLQSSASLYLSPSRSLL
jgi:endoribonuclease Dicer